jgi:small subunit ribosomal protein S16
VAVKIRLMRVGKKKQPTYRVVVADGRSPRDGRFIEILGHYAPREDPSRIEIDGDSALAWLRKGAQPTEQVQKLLTVTGVWGRYESERRTPAVTKLTRRGHVARGSGSGPRSAPASGRPAGSGAPSASAPAAPTGAAPAEDAPAEDAPAEGAAAEDAAGE